MLDRQVNRLRELVQANDWESAAALIEQNKFWENDVPDWVSEASWLVYLKLNEMAKSEFWLDRALASNPNRPSLLRGKGNLHRDRGEWSEASENYSRAIKLSPGTAIYYAALAFAQESMRDYSNSISSLRKAIDINPKLNWRLRLATLYLKEGKLEIALMTLEDCLESNIDSNINEKIILLKNIHSAEKKPTNGTIEYCYEYVRKGLDKEFPGRGQETSPVGPIDQAMAYGLIAWAASLAGKTDDVENSVNWLIEKSRTRRGTGWGLGFQWSPFSKSFKNDSETIYGITNAICIQGLLESHKISPNPSIYETIIAALDYYSECRSILSDGGSYFWYSDQVTDSKQVYNVSSMLAGTFARASVELEIPGYAKIAHSAAQSIVDDVLFRENHIDWLYEKGGKRHNDLVHASYIIKGLLDTKKYLNVDYIGEKELEKYLLSFFDKDKIIREHNSIDDYWLAPVLRPRSWGLGMAAFVLGEMGLKENRDNVLDTLGLYEFESHNFSYKFGDQQHIPRSVAHILLAFSLKK